MHIGYAMRPDFACRADASSVDHLPVPLATGEPIVVLFENMALYAEFVDSVGRKAQERPDVTSISVRGVWIP